MPVKLPKWTTKRFSCVMANGEVPDYYADTLAAIKADAAEIANRSGEPVEIWMHIGSIVPPPKNPVIYIERNEK